MILLFVNTYEGKKQNIIFNLIRLIKLLVCFDKSSKILSGAFLS